MSDHTPDLVRQWQDLKARPDAPVAPEWSKRMARRLRTRRWGTIATAAIGVALIVYGLSQGFAHPIAHVCSWLGSVLCALAVFHASRRP